ncbi:MAG: protein kinase [Candidatus Schekmanbacteria bacterium]|nr:protein kinase [Candidatus Schekmanbacteria bacterium]
MLQTVGPYAVVRPLGRGGEGVVYLARRDSDSEPVAIKTVVACGAAKTTAIRREIRALARLSHPGIVRVIDHGMDGGVHWYAMEHVNGRDLRDHCALVRATERTAAARIAGITGIVMRLAETLAYLHGEGLVHRDLKPENILVRLDGSPVLVDFGLSTSFSGRLGQEDLELAGVVVGTIRYMSPEQIRGELVDSRADLYSLGCVAFEMLTGRPPFCGATIGEVIRGHLRGVAPVPSSLDPCLPSELDALLLALLAKEPDQRPGYAADVAERLVELGARPPATRASPSPRSFLLRSAISGRETELATLHSALASATKGRGGIVILEGESGLGKTRLALELSREATKQGLLVLVGDCSPPPAGASAGAASAGSALEAFRRPLEELAERCAEHGPETVERVIGPRGAVLGLYEPAIRDLPGQGTLAAAPELPADAAARRLFTCLAETLFMLALEEPVLLVIDDLQWADDLSLRCLQYLARQGQIDRMRMLILGAYRSEEQGRGLADLRTLPTVLPIALSRLNLAAVERMIETMLAPPAAQAELADFMLTRAQGNPFFVTELLLMALDVGALRRERFAGWRVHAGEQSRPLAALAAMPFPPSLAEVLVRRLAALDGLALAVVGAAAALGREIDEELLLAVLERPLEQVSAALGELRRRQVLEVDGGGSLRFPHDKLRTEAYATLAADRRLSIHLRAAALLASAPLAVRLANLGQIAEHWFRGGDLEQARQAYLSAAKHAWDMAALAAAEGYTARALALTAAETVQAAVVHRGRAAVRELRGRFPEALEDLAAAVRIYTAGADPHAAAECHIAAAALLSRIQRAADALCEARQALALLRGSGDRGTTARAMLYEGVALWMQGDRDATRGRLEAALQVATELRDNDLEVRALGYLGLIALESGDFGDAMARCNRGLEHTRELSRHSRSRSSLLVNLGTAQARSGDHVGARHTYAEAFEVCHRSGDVVYEAEVLGNLGALMLEMERDRAALKYFEEAHRVFARVGEAAGTLRMRNNIAIVRLEMGHLGRALLVQREVVSAHEAGRNVRALAWSRYNYGVCLHEAGARAAAMAQLEASAVLCRSLGDRFRLAEVQHKLGEILFETEEAAAALIAFREVAAVAAALPYPALAVSAGVRIDLAQAHLEQRWPGMFVLVPADWPRDAAGLRRAAIVSAARLALSLGVGGDELADCLVALAELEARARKSGARRDLFTVYLLMATALAALGDHAGARRARRLGHKDVARIVQQLPEELRNDFRVRALQLATVCGLPRSAKLTGGLTHPRSKEIPQ